MSDVAPLSAAGSVEIRRSARRRRTVSAYRDGDRIVVLVPARLSKSEERRLVTEMVELVTSREAVLARRGPRASDGALAERSERLSREHLGGRAKPTSVRWVANMEHRWGSCTPADGTIRLSHRLQSMPAWVIDYVLVHELSHLLEPGHGPEFWDLVARYPRTERARGFLEGVAVAAQLPGLSDCVPSPDGSSPGRLSLAGRSPEGRSPDGDSPDGLLF
jgi:predicted metal-dependent hydrolase